MEISEVSNNNWLSIFDIIHFDEQNIKNPISEQEKKEKWVPDEKANYCFNCNKEFSALFQRKHHQSTKQSSVIQTIHRHNKKTDVH